jgi:hypothetical protein
VNDEPVVEDLSGVLELAIHGPGPRSPGGEGHEDRSDPRHGLAEREEIEGLAVAEELIELGLHGEVTVDERRRRGHVDGHHGAEASHPSSPAGRPSSLPTLPP